MCIYYEDSRDQCISCCAAKKLEVVLVSTAWGIGRKLVSSCLHLCVRSQVLPSAHRGFLERARRVPVERLLAQAQKQDKKLLLCGHVRPKYLLSPPPQTYRQELLQLSAEHISLRQKDAGARHTGSGGWNPKRKRFFCFSRDRLEEFMTAVALWTGRRFI